MADDESTWMVESAKALLPGGITSSIFGVVGAFVGSAWYDSQPYLPAACTFSDAASFCRPPSLPAYGTVHSATEAATVFGIGIAAATLIVCIAILALKKR